MPIVDYSTPRRGEDLTSPNAGQPKDTVIVPSSPAHITTRIIDEEIFVTQRLGPLILAPGESIDVLSITGEQGDIISIEVVTDNPYTGVFLEMDDYRNKEAVGITAAELILKNKITPHNREFYAEDMREDGTFVVKYSPVDPDPYTDRIKVQVRNDITGRTTRAPVPSQSLKMRGGLPTPLNLGFAAGYFVTHTSLASATLAETPTILRQLGRDAYFAPIKNLAVSRDPSILAGAYHPYMGLAGEFVLSTNAAPAGARLVSGAPGQKLSSTTGFPTPNTVAWPGKQATATFIPSQQQFIVYKSKTEDETETGFLIEDIGLNLQPALFVKVGDTVYFPGSTDNNHIFFYDVPSSQWKSTETVGYSEGADGAYMFTCEPGLPFKLPKVTQLLTADGSGKNVDGWGTCQAPGFELSNRGHMRIHEIVVRRKKKKYLQG